MYWVRKIISLFLLVIISSALHAQSGQAEQVVQKKIETGFRYLYEFQFHKADSISHATLQQYPREPLAHLLRAHYYWYLIVSGLNNKINQDKCIAALTQAEHLQANKKNSGLNHDELFTKITIQVLFARLESLNGNDWNSFTHLHSGTQSIKYSLDKENQYPYFLLVNGLYLYYRSYARKAYPYLAPYLVLMPAGNEEKGLQMLRKAVASKDPYLSCEAKYFLMKLCMARNWNQEAYELSQSLLKQFPKNLLFAWYHANLCKILNQTAELNEVYHKMLLIDPAGSGYQRGQKDYFIAKVRTLMP